MTRLLFLGPCVCVTGILWIMLINNNGFTPGSQAKPGGVLCGPGNILRKVDGQDVLKMKSEVQA